MDCSIIIPFYRNLSHLETSVHHAQQALYKVVGEIIVINDNPTIDIPHAISSKAKIINLEKNIGYSSACNKGAEIAIGTYLFFQDSDVFIEKECINELLKCEKFFTESAISACVLRSSDLRIHHFGISFFQTDVLKPYRGGKRYNELLEPVEFQAITSDSMLVKRKLFHDCGGFETELKNSYSDLDFSFKINEKGGKNVVCPQAISLHRSRSAGLNRTNGEEDYKCAFFKQWGHKIINDFKDLFKHLPYTYLLSGLDPNAYTSFCFLASTYAKKYKDTFEDVTSQHFDWIDINHSQDKIRLEDYIPWSLITAPKKLMFFVDSIDQLVNNEFLIKNRPQKVDVCIDRNGNIIYLEDLSSSS